MEERKSILQNLSFRKFFTFDFILSMCYNIPMAKIILRDYQVNAVKFALNVPRSVFCMRVGSGKTICAMFTLRELFKQKFIDKAVVACTKSSVSVFREDFKDKANLKVRLIEDETEFINFLKGDERVCLVKHSMFEKLGNDAIMIAELQKLDKQNLNVALVIDEAHKIQNPDGVTHEAFMRIADFFSNIYLYTATPYSSCLSQFYGLIHLIYPHLWKSKAEFFRNYIDEITIKDPRTYRVVRKEKVRYKNLKEFREKIEPFTYFYYPSIPLVYIEHHTRLEDYEEYDDLCKGVLDEETIAKIKKRMKDSES